MIIVYCNTKTTRVGGFWKQPPKSPLPWGFTAPQPLSCQERGEGVRFSSLDKRRLGEVAF
jgi:hypothetical protein